MWHLQWFVFLQFGIILIECGLHELPPHHHHQHHQHQHQHWPEPPPYFSATDNSTGNSLPEIIVNRKSLSQHDGYNYDPPVSADSGQVFPAPPSSEYLPPTQYPIGVQPPPSPAQDVPFEEPALSLPQVSEYLPPSVPPPPPPQQQQPQTPSQSDDGYFYPRPIDDSADYLRTPKTVAAPLRLDLTELKCAQTGYFHATITALANTNIEHLPLIDSDNGRLPKDSRCVVNRTKGEFGERFGVAIAAGDFQRCGVRQCGRDLCLRLRFPQIVGMRTGGDPTLKLQCRVQERVVTRTHALRVGVAPSSSVAGRARTQSGAGADVAATSVVAHGGAQQPFHSQLALFRRATAGGHFTRPIDANGIVLLGEEMLLRVQVRSGDGWNYSRIADVSLERHSSDGELLQRAALLTAAGCANPQMRAICPQGPFNNGPLGHRLAFRAPMFDGMLGGDALVLSVRVIGCMDQHDCAPCTSRKRRQTPDGQTHHSRNQSLMPSEISSIAFRVAAGIQLPDSDAPPLSASSPSGTDNIRLATVGGVCGVALIALLAVIVWTQRR